MPEIGLFYERVEQLRHATGEPTHYLVREALHPSGLSTFVLCELAGRLEEQHGPNPGKSVKWSAEAIATAEHRRLGLANPARFIVHTPAHGSLTEHPVDGPVWQFPENFYRLSLAWDGQRYRWQEQVATDRHRVALLIGREWPDPYEPDWGARRRLAAPQGDSMQRTIRFFRVLPDGGELEVRLSGEEKLRALLAFEAWALDLMRWDAPVEGPTLHETPLQFNLERPSLMLELAYQEQEQPGEIIAPPPPRWLVSVAGLGWQVTRREAFPDDEAGRVGAVRFVTTQLLSDEGPAWVG